MNIISLTTDFGLADWFVGTLKGVVWGVNPRARIADITHTIPPGDVRAGAFALAASYRYFPRNTIHIAVVDPGVGGHRRAIAVQTLKYTFVGPDNGVLSFALAREKIKAAHQITNSRLCLQPVSNTFHGRDVFAPVAARLSKGLPIGKVGPVVKDFVKLDWPKPRIGQYSIEGEVIHIDRFGNATTNIPATAVASKQFQSFQVLCRGRRLCPLNASYQSVPTGKPVSVIGSGGFVEIAVNGGSAAQLFHLRIGSAIMLRPRRRSKRD